MEEAEEDRRRRPHPGLGWAKDTSTRRRSAYAPFAVYTFHLWSGIFTGRYCTSGYGQVACRFPSDYGPRLVQASGRVDPRNSQRADPQRAKGTQPEEEGIDSAREDRGAVRQHPEWFQGGEKQSHSYGQSRRDQVYRRLSTIEGEAQQHRQGGERWHGLRRRRGKRAFWHEESASATRSCQPWVDGSEQTDHAAAGDAYIPGLCSRSPFSCLRCHQRCMLVLLSAVL